MKKVLIINTHLRYPYSEGKLTSAVIEKTSAQLSAMGHSVRHTSVEGGYDVAEELEKHVWADAIIVQIPVNWMGAPWIFKKYVDEVYSAGMGGILCAGDGRSRENPAKQYGSGGMLGNTKYMLSLTYNAPAEAFGDENQYLMRGGSPDDMFLPCHLNFRFFGMKPLETFVCYDVIKNPDVENDFVRLEKHLNAQFGE